MSSDLISKRRLSKEICNKECDIPKFETERELNAFLLGLNAKQIAVMECLSTSPVAYDADKVVEQISDLVKPTEQYRHNFCGTVTDEHCANYENCEHCIVEKIVKIVKSGGIE